MRKILTAHLFLFLVTGIFSCANDNIFLPGYIKRAHDAVMVSCDPYNLGVLHTCVVFSSAFQNSLYIYDASARKMVFAPNKFPLKVKVGNATDVLVKVVSPKKKFPIMLAIDRAKPGIYPIRLFSSADKTEESFTSPDEEKIDQPIFKAAAAQMDERILLVLTRPEQQEIQLMALNAENGIIDDKIPPKVIKVGTRPSHVAIDDLRSIAVITDEKEKKIHVLKLASAMKSLTTKAIPEIKSIDVGITSGRLYLSHRDFGAGSHLYALIFESQGRELKLINMDHQKVEDSIVLDEFPTAGYFPNENSNSCCKSVKEWFSVVTIKGSLLYISIDRLATGKIKLEQVSSIDLKNQHNLAVSNVNITNIIGGEVEKDLELNRETICSNRQTFYISSFASSKSYFGQKTHEIEGHGYSCEGEESASRFGLDLSLSKNKSDIKP
jgi:hypothetical protein